MSSSFWGTSLTQGIKETAITDILPVTTIHLNENVPIIGLGRILTFLLSVGVIPWFDAFIIYWFGYWGGSDVAIRLFLFGWYTQSVEIEIKLREILINNYMKSNLGDCTKHILQLINLKQWDFIVLPKLIVL